MTFITSRYRGWACIIAALVLAIARLEGQDSPASQDSLRVRSGSEIGIPVASVFLPGLGQYMHGAPARGLVYTGVAVGGLSLYLRDTPDTLHEIPRTSRDQLNDVGAQFAMDAMWLSGWDAFHRAVPAMQQRGRYQFLPRRESIPQLISAPFDYRFLGRWTTQVDLAYSALITALILSDRNSNEAHYPFRAQEAAYTASLSANAAIGEEAFFRGYLLPMVYQKSGQKFWVANTTQSLLFTVGHSGFPVTLVTHMPWAMWEGWIVRRNNWSIRESIFHHFWYDAAVVTAAALAEEKPATVRLRFPSIRF